MLSRRLHADFDAAAVREILPPVLSVRAGPDVADGRGRGGCRRAAHGRHLPSRVHQVLWIPGVLRVAQGARPASLAPALR